MYRRYLSAHTLYRLQDRSSGFVVDSIAVFANLLVWVELRCLASM